MKGVAKVAKIDASIHRKFDQVYGLKGYPQVVMIPAGKNIQIQVLRTNQSTMFMKELEQPIVFNNGLQKRSNKTKDFWSKDSQAKKNGMKTAYL